MRGDLPESVTYREGNVVLRVDLLGGQNTGSFLDQRENHLASAAYARGEALDCFSYTGGFALQLAARETKVNAVEISEAAADARRRVQIVEKRGASRDHPVMLGLRETRYLKCFVLRATS